MKEKMSSETVRRALHAQTLYFKVEFSSGSYGSVAVRLWGDDATAPELLIGLHGSLAYPTLLLVLVHTGGLLVENWRYDERFVRLTVIGEGRCQ